MSIAAVAIGLLGCFHAPNTIYGSVRKWPFHARRRATASPRHAGSLSNGRPVRASSSSVKEDCSELSFDGRPVPYESHIVSVVCERR